MPQHDWFAQFEAPAEDDFFGRFAEPTPPSADMLAPEAGGPIAPPPSQWKRVASDIGQGLLSELSGTTPRREGLRFGQLRPDIDAALSGAEVMGSPMTPLSAGALKTAQAVPEAARRVFGISAKRAGQRMEAVAQAAKDVPVRALPVGSPLARAKELQSTGSRMPRAATQLSRRIEQAQGGELSFREAQDFVSSMSRLSVNERNALNPQMHRQIALIRDALRGALTEAAETVGRGSQYTRGVREYAKAARAAERWEATKPALARTLKHLGYGLIGYKAMSDFGGGLKSDYSVTER